MKKPSDKKLLSGFNDFEKGFNVALAFARNVPDGTDVGDATSNEATITPAHAEHALWQAHDVYRRMALAAQRRLAAREST